MLIKKFLLQDLFVMELLVPKLLMRCAGGRSRKLRGQADPKDEHGKADGQAVVYLQTVDNKVAFDNAGGQPAVVQVIGYSVTNS